jgi:hypothetical protein
MEYFVSMPKGPLRLWMRPIFITSPVAGALELVETEPRTRVDTIATTVTKTVNDNLLRIFTPPLFDLADCRQFAYRTYLYLFHKKSAGIGLVKWHGAPPT